MVIEGREIERISIVDDDEAVRASYRDSVQDLNLLPVPEAGPLPELDIFVAQGATRAEAAVCDFKLRVKNYATFDGAELVARWFDMGFPALLCTKWDHASVDEMRRFRSRVPVLIRPTDLDPDRIRLGLCVCIKELNGDLLDTRKVYRALVRVEEVVATGVAFVYVVVPAWDSSQVVKLPLADIPVPIREKAKPDARLYAEVNLGAESYEDLFFRSWEGA